MRPGHETPDDGGTPDAPLRSKTAGGLTSEAGSGGRQCSKGAAGGGLARCLRRAARRVLPLMLERRRTRSSAASGLEPMRAALSERSGSSVRIPAQRDRAIRLNVTGESG